MLAVLLAACSTIDCPFNNTVMTKYRLRGDVTTLTDTLTVSAALAGGNDSVIINRDVRVDSFMLPMSYNREADVFYFQVADTAQSSTDTVTVTKQDQPHFESVDCSPSFFHTITGVTTTHHAIDSIVINNKNVTYDANPPHFYIYFKSHTR